MAITSWTSEGMDWDNIDPSNYAYYEAIHLALIERYEAFGWNTTGVGWGANSSPFVEYSHEANKANGVTLSLSGQFTFFSGVNRAIAYLAYNQLFETSLINICKYAYSRSAHVQL